MTRHFTPRKAEGERHDYEYTRCLECGHTYYDPIDDYLGQAVGEPEFGFPDILTGLYALTPSEVPMLGMMKLMAKADELRTNEKINFVWEGADDEG